MSLETDLTGEYQEILDDIETIDLPVRPSVVLNELKGNYDSDTAEMLLDLEDEDIIIVESDNGIRRIQEVDRTNQTVNKEKMGELEGADIDEEIDDIDFYTSQIVVLPEQVDSPSKIPDQTWWVMNELKEGRTQQEVAKQMDVSITVVKSILEPVKGSIIENKGSRTNPDYVINFPQYEESEALVPQSFEHAEGSIIINPDNEDLRQAIEDRYEEDEVQIDMFDISESDIEDFVSAFDLIYDFRDDNTDVESVNGKRGEDASKEEYSSSEGTSGENSKVDEKYEEPEEDLENIRKARNGEIDSEIDSEDDKIEDEDLKLEQNTEEPSLSDIFEMLKNDRRRRVLRYLEDEGSGNLRDLAGEMAAVEGESDHYSSRERNSIYVGLYQCHLPRLSDLGFIEFDQNRGDIQKGEYFEEAAQYLPNSFGEGDAELTFDDGFWQKMRREVDKFTNIFYR